MYNEQLCTQVRQGLRAIENTGNPVDTDKVRELVKYIFNDANVNGVADYYLSNGKGSWYATINKPTIPSSPVSDFYLVKKEEGRRNPKDLDGTFNKEAPYPILPPSSDKELFQWVKASERNPDKNGEYIVKACEGDLVDHVCVKMMERSGNKWHYYSEGEDNLKVIEWLEKVSPVQPKEELRSAEEILNDNKPYGRNWEDFLLPDQMEFLYKAIHAYHAQFTQVKDAYTREDMEQAMRYGYTLAANNMKFELALKDFFNWLKNNKS